MNAAILSALPKSERSIARIAPTAAGYMERCQSALAASITGRGPYRTAAVACASPRWTLYARISLESLENVLVATRSVPIGQILAMGDVRVVRMPSSDVPGEPISAGDVIGKEAAAPLAPGQTITRNQIIIPPAVRNGEKVSVHWTGAGVAATTAGTALESGGIGQSILVENDESHRTITASIVAPDSPATTGQAFIIAPK